MTSDLGSGTLAALLGSGRIEILSSQTLREKLTSWEGVIGEVWDDQANNAKSVFEIHIPYFLAADIPAGAVMHLWYDEWPLTRKSLSDDPEMVSRLVHDETLRCNGWNLDTGTKGTLRLNLKTRIIAVDEILTEIESSIH